MRLISYPWSDVDPNKETDVVVFGEDYWIGPYLCVGPEDEQTTLNTTEELYQHLVDHKIKGHRVPRNYFDQIRNECVFPRNEE